MPVVLLSVAPRTIAMVIEVAASRFPDAFGPVLLDYAHESTRLIAILDGTGSWEAGDASAVEVAHELRARWASKAPSTSNELIQHVATAAKASANRQPANIFARAGFSFVAVLVTDEHALVVSCGSYAVLHLQRDHANVVYQPSFWVDEQVRLQALTPDEALSHKLRHIYTGPLVSAETTIAAYHCSAPARTGSIVVMTMELARHLLRLPVATWVHQTATQLQNREQDGAAHMRPVVRIDIDAA